MLEGKVAIVTGGSRGIGKAIAVELAKNGANIAIVCAAEMECIEQAAAEIEQLGVKAKAYKCDVSSFEQTKNTIEQVLNDFEHVDILINNAGITRDGLILTMTEQDFDAVINVNLKGTFNTTKSLYQHFMKRRYGKIVNIASVIGIAGNAGQSNYASAKAGIIGLTKSTAKELASRNITCNAIAPGFIETDMTKKLPEAVLNKAMEQIPLKKLGTPEDVAKLAVFLSSDNASYITGEVIKVGGGMFI